MKKYLLILVILPTFTTYLNAQTLFPISEGINPAGSTPKNLTKLRSQLYLFRATGVNNDIEPYVTDGTQSGTFLLKDINQGIASSYPAGFFRINDTVCIFSANDGDTIHGKELWRSNGTTSGTYMVADLTPGSASTNIVFSKVTLNNKIFFSTYTSGGLGTLYITGGDSLSTIQLLSGYDAYFPNTSGKVIAVVNGIAYLPICEGPYHELHLWRTDGTVPGTFEIMDLNMNAGNQQFAFSLGNDFFFDATDSIHGQELWKTDGTINGTVMIKDLNPGTASGNPNHPHLINNKILFDAQSNGFSNAMWITDGTFTGTYELDDSLFSVNDYCYFVGKSGNEIYFAITDDSTELWKTDGTAVGTVHVHTFPYCDLESGANDDTMATAFGVKFFVVEDPQYIGYLASLWATDGTDAGTFEICSSDAVSFSPISQLTSICDQVFFVMEITYYADEVNLWTVNQDTAYDMNLFMNSNEDPFIYFVDDSAIFFTAYDTHLELFRLQVCGVFTPTQNISTTNTLSLFPNPNDGLFTLELPDNLTNAEVRVNDMMGKCRFVNKISASPDRKLNLHLENIPSGIYSLQITSNEERWQQIFIKQ